MDDSVSSSNIAVYYSCCNSSTINKSVNKYFDVIRNKIIFFNSIFSLFVNKVCINNNIKLSKIIPPAYTASPLLPESPLLNLAASPPQLLYWIPPSLLNPHFPPISPSPSKVPLSALECGPFSRCIYLHVFILVAPHPNLLFCTFRISNHRTKHLNWNHQEKAT